VPIPQDDYQLENLAGEHGIGADLFIPFVIRRLRLAPDQTEAVLTLTLRDIDGKGDRRRDLNIKWFSASVPDEPAGVSENTVTEWAALGVACIVAALYAELSIQAVTAQGDRFDYWVTDGRKDYGLEVSGTLTGDVKARHGLKVRQWRENPFGVDGYVMTAGFTSRDVIFSFHHFEEKRT
jgi:hypothetical protein